MKEIPLLRGAGVCVQVVKSSFVEIRANQPNLCHQRSIFKNCIFAIQAIHESPLPNPNKMKTLLSTLLLFLSLQSNSFSQTWDTLANIPVGLAFPVVVVLNAEIHVIGGGGPSGATGLHLRYKPATDIWDTLAPVPYLAQQPSGAVVNGKIHYFGGGFPNSGTPLASHYSYDPSSDTWTVAASLPIPRVIMEAASINNKIYALSGQPDKTRVDEYNPVTDTWTSKNPLPDMNFWYSAMVVQNNEMYRFGGGGFTSPVNFANKYDSVSDSWTYLTHLASALHAPAAASLGGLIYIAGGYNAGDISATQTFNPATSAYSPALALPIGRSYHELVTIDTCIYSVGGNNSAYPNMNLSLLRYCNSGNVSVNEIKKVNSILIYPNPATNYISIKNENVSESNLELFNILGVKRMTVMVKKGEQEIDISSLSEGIYFYNVTDSSTQKTFVGKLVVVR